MKDKYEVLVTGDTGGGLGVWDPSTGNCLHQYMGGVTRANTATWVKQVNTCSTRVSVEHFISTLFTMPIMTDAHFQDWLLSAPPDKPLLNVWLASKAEQAPVRLFTPAPTQVRISRAEK